MTNRQCLATIWTTEEEEHDVSITLAMTCVRELHSDRNIHRNTFVINPFKKHGYKDYLLHRAENGLVWHDDIYGAVSHEQNREKRKVPADQQAITFDPRDIYYLTVTAVEHMGHGCLSYFIEEEKVEEWHDCLEENERDFFSVKVANTLLTGGTVEVRDRWEYELTGTVDLDQLKKAIIHEASRKGMTAERWLEQHDVLDADCAFQRAAFGKIMLG